MKQHTNQNLRRALSLFMTALLIMSCLTAAFGVIRTLIRERLGGEAK